MKYSIFSSVIVILFLSFYFSASDGQDSIISEFSVEQVFDKVKTDSTIFLLDVRSEAEFYGELGHIPGAVLINLAELETRLDELESIENREIIVVCRSSNRSGIATRMLRENGYNAFNMVGGMRAWNAMMRNPEFDQERNQNEAVIK